MNLSQKIAVLAGARLTQIDALNAPNKKLIFSFSKANGDRRSIYKSRFKPGESVRSGL